MAEYLTFFAATGDDEQSIEMHYEDDGKLQAWTEKSSIAPNDETIDELTQDLQYMFDDIAKWNAVPFSSLQIRMAFERN